MKPRIIFFAFIGFFVLILFSESLYALRNNPEVKIRLYLNLARVSSKASRVQGALNFLGKVAEIRLEEIAKGYPEVNFKTTETVPPIPENPQLNKDYTLFLQGLDYKLLAQPAYTKWAKTFYTLGLLAYKNNETDLVIPFWQAAINIAPEWSYFHIELANFYSSTGDILNAKETLNYCLKFNYTKEHCQLFLNDNLESGSYEEIGFMEKDINEEI